MIHHDRLDYAMFVVRTALGRYERMPAEAIRPDHQLHADLGVDAFDLALVAVRIEDELDVDLDLGDVAFEEKTTVRDLASLVARACEERTRRDVVPKSA